MRKILVLFVMAILLVSCGEKAEQKQEVKKQEVKKQEQKFGELTIYVKADITDEETEKLKEILEQRKQRQEEIKKMIEEATAENKDETYNKIVEMRKTCMGRIIPYVAENKVDSFKKYCEKTNFYIKKKLDEL